jgi:oligosaccharide repeat unit polymerase
VKISPQNIFLLVWCFPLIAPFIIVSDIIPHISFYTRMMVLINILFFYFVGLIFWLTGYRGNEAIAKRALSYIKYPIFEKKISKLFAAWIVIYVINIIGSGGIPIIWILIGDPRNYADFGLPTLGGLGNLLRAFLLVACYLIYFHSNLSKKIRFRYALIGFFLICSAFVLETGRGNGVVLLLHPIGFHLLITKIRPFNIFKWTIFLFLFLFGLGAIQAARYQDGMVLLEKYAENSGFEKMTGPLLFLVPAITYISIPIVNTDLNLINSPNFKFSPNYSLQGLIPTIIRDSIIEKGDYGELINEANNVSSFYIPFLRDFGLWGTIIFISFIQLLVVYCYLRAQRGNVYFVFFWPPLFMSVVLSFFSLYFTSLVVVLYPLVVVWTLKGVLSSAKTTPLICTIQARKQLISSFQR